MDVRVDQAGQDGLAGKIKHSRARAARRQQLRAGTGGKDAAVLDRHRLRNGKPWIDGDDFGVENEQIRFRGLSPGRGDKECCNADKGKHRNNPKEIGASTGAFHEVYLFIPTARMTV
jgi:hypothetical protein